MRGLRIKSLLDFPVTLNGALLPARGRLTLFRVGYPDPEMIRLEGLGMIEVNQIEVPQSIIDQVLGPPEPLEEEDHLWIVEGF